MTKLTIAEEPKRKRGAQSSEAALAASAHSRINIPLNLDNWRDLHKEIQEPLFWFHRHLLDENMSYSDAEKALGYDRSTIYRILKGIYNGNWANIVKAINTYREIALRRARIQQSVYVENETYEKIATALNYALANNSITLICGESRRGKTSAVKHWASKQNGRAVFVTVDPLGGVRNLLRNIAIQVGVNRNLATGQMLEAIYRAFNHNMILLVDEAHLCLSADSRADVPVRVEMLRRLHDQTGCGLALIATRRFIDRLKKGAYQYEQLLGRVGIPLILSNKVTEKEIRPIVTQYIPEPDEDTIDELLDIANKPGRLGNMVELLKFADQLAKADNETPTGRHVKKAAAIRLHVSGGGEI